MCNVTTKSDADLDADAVEAFSEFSFLKTEFDREQKGSDCPTKQETVATTKESLDVLKERYM